MTNLFAQKLRLLSVAVLLTGVIAITVVYARKYTGKRHRSTGFTIALKQTVSVDGDPTTPWVVQSSVRYQKADGNWKQVTTFYNRDGTVRGTSSGFGQVGRGVFMVDERRKMLKYVSGYSAQHAKFHDETDDTEDSLRKDPKFVREEPVLGYKAYVLRFPNDTDSGYTESYFAAGFQGFPIKKVFVDVDVDRRATTTIEPTKIELGEPPPQEFAVLPNYPVDYSLFEKKIEIMEKENKHDIAEQMRQQLQQLKSQK